MWSDRECAGLGSERTHAAPAMLLAWEIESAGRSPQLLAFKSDVALISSDLHDGPGKGLLLASELHLKLPDTHSVILLENEDCSVRHRASSRGLRQ